MNRKKHLTVFSSLLLALSLTACSNTENDTGNEEVVDTTATDISEQSNVARAESSQDKQKTDRLISIPSIPLSSYHDIKQDADAEWLTWFFVSNSDREFSDEEKLDLLSPEYYNEEDAFRKQALKQELLPKIDEGLAKYKGDYRIAIPIVGYFDDKDFITYISDYAFGLEAYDFDSNSFPVRDCGNAEFSIKNKQNIELQIHYPNRDSYMQYAVDDNDQKLLEDDKVERGFCQLQVEDQQLARKIEQARSQSKLGSIGTMYVKPIANKGYIAAHAVLTEVTYYDRETKESFITKKFDHGTKHINTRILFQ